MNKPSKNFPAPGTLHQARKLADYLKHECGMKILSITKDGPCDDPKIEAHNGERPLLYSVDGDNVVQLALRTKRGWGRWKKVQIGFNKPKMKLRRPSKKAVNAPLSNRQARTLDLMFESFAFNER